MVELKNYNKFISASRINMLLNGNKKKKMKVFSTQHQHERKS